jgi:hypothetical protein
LLANDSVRWTALFALLATAALSAEHRTFTVEQRLAVLNRATVWESRDIASLDVRTGPPGPGAFEPEEVVSCDYTGQSASGHSPKFNCAITKTDHVKVKYGAENGEVYSEVASTRLLWMLGFYADRMYPVKVLCRGCPKHINGSKTDNKDVIELPIAAIEREIKGLEVELRNRRGWEWGELDIAKGSTRAQRDALKLLTVMLQHTDSKSEQAATGMSRRGLRAPGRDGQRPWVNLRSRFALQLEFPEQREPRAVVADGGVGRQDRLRGEHQEVVHRHTGSPHGQRRGSRLSRGALAADQ